MLLVFILLLATSLIVITSCVLTRGPKYYSQGGSKFAGDSGLPLSVDTGEENLFQTRQLLQQANVCEGKPEKYNTE